MVRFAATSPVWDAREVDPPRPVQSWAAMARAIFDALLEARGEVTYAGLRNRLVEAEACREIAELSETNAQQAVELAQLKASLAVADAKIREELAIDETDEPAQVARNSSAETNGAPVAASV